MRHFIALLACLCLVRAGPVMGQGAGVSLDHPIQSDSATKMSLGMVPQFRTQNKFGETDNLDAAATDIWDGSTAEIVAISGTIIWVPPNAARIHALVSSSLADSDSGGANPQSTGMRTVEVCGLETWTSTSATTETVILDGTTAVNTVNSYVIIYRMTGLAWGSGGVNAGSITADAAVDGTTTAAITIGNNQTQMLIYGISSTMKLRVDNFRSSLIKTSGANLRATGKVLWMADPAANAAANTAWVNKESFELTTDDSWIRPYSPPKKFDGPGIIKLQLVGSGNDIDAIATFDATIKDD